VSGSPMAVEYQWEGLDKDAATGLYYDDARFYSSAIGRPLSQDPLGFAAGDSNLYRYVNNEPTNATDPSGLQAPIQGSGGQTGDHTISERFNDNFKIPDLPPLGPLGRPKGKGSYDVTVSITTNPNAATKTTVAGNVTLRWEIPLGGIDLDTKSVMAMLPSFLQIPDDWADLKIWGGAKVIVSANADLQAAIQNGKMRGTLNFKGQVTVVGGVQGSATIGGYKADIEGLLYAQGSLNLGGGIEADFNKGFKNVTINGINASKLSAEVGVVVKVPALGLQDKLVVWSWP